jgi:hypothetical protein
MRASGYRMNGGSTFLQRKSRGLHANGAIARSQMRCSTPIACVTGHGAKFSKVRNAHVELAFAVTTDY